MPILMKQIILFNNSPRKMTKNKPLTSPRINPTTLINKLMSKSPTMLKNKLMIKNQVKSSQPWKNSHYPNVRKIQFHV